MNYKFLFFLIISIFISSCNENKGKETIIQGDISNLPDGTIYLYKDKYDNRIDSVKTKNGKFEIRYNPQNTEPQYLGLDHVDNSGVLRAIGFPTINSKFKGSAINSQYFFSDPIISIKGKLKDFKAKGITLEKKYKIVISPKISAGIQTEALYNIDADLFDKINDSSIQIIKEKIKKYPFSFHLLYQISDNKNSFSPQQVDQFLKLFKGEITESESYKKLSAYNKKRYTEKNSSLPFLENAAGGKSAILDSKYKKHLVVFWASWCGPCRQEIPLLKKIYSAKEESIEFVSISIDENKNAWQKALNEEKMDWKQLMITEKDPNYEKIQMHFRLNGAIPYTVLVDNNFKIIKSTVGLSSEKDLQDFIENK
jgi:thiol-disulfide isomerase/thioredoxin